MIDCCGHSSEVSGKFVESVCGHIGLFQSSQLCAKLGVLVLLIRRQGTHFFLNTLYLGLQFSICLEEFPFQTLPVILVGR